MTLPVRRHSACVLEIEPSGVLRDDVDIELQGDELVVGPRACGDKPATALSWTYTLVAPRRDGDRS